jgi:hypothetical protein
VLESTGYTPNLIGKKKRNQIGGRYWKKELTWEDAGGRRW